MLKITIEILSSPAYSFFNSSVHFKLEKTCYYYFHHWNKKDDKNSKSILEIVLKKIGWRGQKKQWSERENKLCNY
ncbi:hypothetical protein [Candidatus Rhabdochlamydia oedothoracis]|uniref:hypothetical protein n=1 Tax=Candidatus Rhabdochlamydia oedothoracis TaxID=2720720 RepID=UPI001C6517B4|nr:hypothetical protein [Candidatus Rhabdochlamydia oedothoracis]